MQDIFFSSIFNIQRLLIYLALEARPNAGTLLEKKRLTLKHKTYWCKQLPEPFPWLVFRAR